MISPTFGGKNTLLKLNWFKWSQRVGKLLTCSGSNISLAHLFKISFHVCHFSRALLPLLYHCTQDASNILFQDFCNSCKGLTKVIDLRFMLLVKLIFQCHKSPLYSHSGLFWLAGPTVPVTPHYLSDNTARCNLLH